jgi:hypothetical protein
MTSLQRLNGRRQYVGSRRSRVGYLRSIEALQKRAYRKKRGKALSCYFRMACRIAATPNKHAAMFHFTVTSFRERMVSSIRTASKWLRWRLEMPTEGLMVEYAGPWVLEAYKPD